MFRPVNPRVPKRVLFGMVKHISLFETKNVHEWGDIWVNRDETGPRLKETSRRIFLDVSHGAWGLGRWEQVGKCVICLTCVLTLFEMLKK